MSTASDKETVETSPSPWQSGRRVENPILNPKRRVENAILKPQRVENAILNPRSDNVPVLNLSQDENRINSIGMSEWVKVENFDYESLCILLKDNPCAIDHFSEIIIPHIGTEIIESKSNPGICLKHLFYLYGLKENHYLKLNMKRGKFNDCSIYYQGPFLQANFTDSTISETLPVFYKDQIIIPDSTLHGRILEFIMEGTPLNDLKFSQPLKKYLNALRDEVKILKPKFNFEDYKLSLQECNYHLENTQKNISNSYRVCGLVASLITYLKYAFRPGDFKYERVKYKEKNIGEKFSYNSYIKMKNVKHYLKTIYKKHPSFKNNEAVKNLFYYTWIHDDITHNANVDWIPGRGLVATESICNNQLLRSIRAKSIFEIKELADAKLNLSVDQKNEITGNLEMPKPEINISELQLETSIICKKTSNIFDWGRQRINK